MNLMTERTSSRIPIVDALRGAAIAGMFVYHFVWDLGFFGVVPTLVPTSPWFKLFGHVIAATFLALVGVSHGLATRNGVRWQPWLLRLSMVVAAAALVTASTYYLFPDSYIFFGILHCIAIASVLVLVFTRAPWPLTAVVDLVMIAAPFAIAAPALDATHGWLGLGVTDPRTNDWRPLLPWSGFALAGLALTQAWPAMRWPRIILDWRGGGVAGRTLVFGGRHSLLIYLAHQPVLLAIAFLISIVVAPRQLPADAAFIRACEARCMEVRPDRAYCSRTCGCVFVQAKDKGLWSKVLQNALSQEERATYDALTQQCVRNSGE